MGLRVGFISVGSANYYGRDYDMLPKALETLEAYASQWDFQLDSVPCEIISADQLAQFVPMLGQSDFLLVQCSAMADTHILLELAKIERPIGIWVVEEPTHSGDIRLHSALTGNLFFSVLRRCHDQLKKAKWFYGAPDSELFKKRLEITVAALKALKAIRDATICQIGGAAPGFYNFDEELLLRESLGIKLCTDTVDHVAEIADVFDEVEVSSALDRITSGMFVTNVSEEQLRRSARVYLALRRIASDNGCAALAVSCWPRFQEIYGVVPCLAFSALGELDDVCVACEGDIGGAISMLTLSRLSSAKSTLMDFTEISVDAGAVLLWHCGFSPRSFAGDNKIKLTAHPMLGRRETPPLNIGVSQDFTMGDGDFTVLRITGKKPRLFSFSGKSTGDVHEGFDGVRVWLNRLKTFSGETGALSVMGTICEAGIEHHYAVCSKDILSELYEFSYWSGLPLVEMREYTDFMK